MMDIEKLNLLKFEVIIYIYLIEHICDVVIPSTYS